MHQVLRLPRFQHCQKRCAYHAKRGPKTRARQHPAQVEQVEMLPLPHEHSPRCTACFACHDFSTAISKVLRLSRKKGTRAATLDNIQQHEMLPLPHEHSPRCTKCCACHDFSTAISKALRLSSKKGTRAARSTTSSPGRAARNAAPRPLPHEHNTRCTKRCACHNFSTAISKVLRLSRKKGTRAARSTTSSPVRAARNAAPATRAQSPMHQALRLPRFQHCHLQSAAPVTQKGDPTRALDNIQLS